MRLYYYTPDTASLPPGRRTPAGGPPVDLERACTAVNGEPSEQAQRLALRSTGFFINEGPAWWLQAAQAAHDAAGVAETRVYLDQVKLLAPILPASLRDFLAFEDHVKRAAARRDSSIASYWYEAPVYYKGNHRAVIGPGDECPWPRYTRRLDFELELAMIVGVGGTDIAAGDAGTHVFGFTIFNDFSARDVQSQEMSAWLGPAKGKDFANAFGPCIVTADEVGAQPDLEMVCRVNGEEWGRARSSDARWSWAQMIEHVSSGEEVWPGDVYGSGTPGGCCGLDLDRELAPGDVVELEIESIGVLRNPIGARPQ